MAELLLTTGDDTLTGTASADTFSGPGGGLDSLTGGAGDDTFVIDPGSAGSIDGGDGIDTVQVSYDLGTVSLSNVEVLAVGAGGQDQLTIAQLNAFQSVSLIGLTYPDQLRSEIMLTGAGGVVDLTTRPDLGGGVKINGFIVDSPITMIGGSGNDQLTGGGYVANMLYGMGGNDTLESGQLGADTLDGGDGDDVLIAFDDANRTLIGGAGNDTVVFREIFYTGQTATADGGSGIDTVESFGVLGNYVFTGFEKLHIASGHLQFATLQQLASFAHISSSLPGSTEIGFTIEGSGGTFSFAGRLAAGVSASGAAWTDSAVHITFGSGRDIFGLSDYDDSANGNGGDDAIAGGKGNDTLSGDAGNDILEGGEGNDVLGGVLGNDTLDGGSGDDVYYVDSLLDVVIEAAAGGTDTMISSSSMVIADNVEILRLAGVAHIDATGNDSANRLVGNAGRNVLDGRGGADTLVGQAGDDIYIVDDAGDLIVEGLNGGYDQVLSSVSMTLGAYVEQLRLIGPEALNGRGNMLANVITGNAGNNRIDGAAGADTMIGGSGNDTFIVDNAGDFVVDESGIDTVAASLSYTLGAAIENLTLVGVGNIDATGNALNNVLRGNTGNNVLDGRGGTDTLVGGLGNDTYVVGSASTVIVETATGGTDTVRSAVGYTLADHLENLTLTGTGNVDATGNALANVLTGNGQMGQAAGNNLLDGGAGADTMSGSYGNDTYMVDNAGDQVIEVSWGADYDVIRSSVSYTIAANVERLELTGTANINATGNSEVNYLVGNAGNNILDPGSAPFGPETLQGGAGNDTYIVKGIVETMVVEAAGEGIDTVRSAFDYILTDNVENLVLTGSSNVSGLGNALANVITGNAGNNGLTGGAGHDTLTGGAGADTFVFNSKASPAANFDTITDFTHGTDKIGLSKLAFDVSGPLGGNPNVLNPVLFLADAPPTNLGHRVLYDTATGVLSYDADGSGSGAAIKLAQLTAGTVVTADDFVLV